MKTYISILRGINVGGQRIIKMDALKALYQELGFKNIDTYIQSGNVIFQHTNSNEVELRNLIQNKIKTAFDFDVPVIVLSAVKLNSIISNNPFAHNSDKNTAYLHITFLAEQPEDFDTVSILSKKSDSEEIHLTQDAIYLYCPNGYGKTKLTNNFIESKLKVQATTRNWKTTLKLQDMSLK